MSPVNPTGQQMFRLRERARDVFIWKNNNVIAAFDNLYFSMMESKRDITTQSFKMGVRGRFLISNYSISAIE